MSAVSGLLTTAGVLDSTVNILGFRAASFPCHWVSFPVYCETEGACGPIEKQV